MSKLFKISYLLMVISTILCMFIHAEDNAYYWLIDAVTSFVYLSALLLISHKTPFINICIVASFGFLFYYWHCDVENLYRLRHLPEFLNCMILLSLWCHFKNFGVYQLLPMALFLLVSFGFLMGIKDENYGGPAIWVGDNLAVAIFIYDFYKRKRLAF